MKIVSWTKLLPLVAALFLVGCGSKKLKRPWSMFPNMHHQPSVRAYEPEPLIEDESLRTGRSMRQPVAGTIPRDLNPYQFAKMSPKANDLPNPLPKTMEVLKSGQRAYNIYCIVCHGERGDGNGNIISNPDTPGQSFSGRVYNSPDRQYPQPPPLHSDRLADMTDGNIYNIITRGGAVMPKYDHIPSEVRWSIVNYLRVLYRASRATEKEVELYEIKKSSYSDKTPHDVINDWR